MCKQFERTLHLIGSDAMEKIYSAKAAVFGLGGVGSYCAEALARCGTGKLLLVDFDIVDVTNINRQLPALLDTVGLYKADVMSARLEKISQALEITAKKVFVSKDNIKEVLDTDCDVVVDAMDNVTAKLALITRCKELNIPVISCMGAGNRLNPAQFAAMDIYETTGDGLARVMRRELRARGIDRLRVVCSKEPPIKPKEFDGIASIAFVPPVCGLIAASEAVNSIVCG